MYRRRITAENNWRFGYSNTTEIDLELDNKNKGKITNIFISATSIILEYSHYDGDELKKVWYDAEFPAHSNLKHFGNKLQRRSFTALPRRISLYGDNIHSFTF